MQKITPSLAKPGEYVFEKVKYKSHEHWAVVNFTPKDGAPMDFKRVVISERLFSKEELEAMLKCAEGHNLDATLLEHLRNTIAKY
jgi:hypothetical protein